MTAGVDVVKVVGCGSRLYLLKSDGNLFVRDSSTEIWHDLSSLAYRCMELPEGERIVDFAVLHPLVGEDEDDALVVITQGADRKRMWDLSPYPWEPREIELP